MKKVKPQTKAVAWPVALIFGMGIPGVVQAALVSMSWNHFWPWLLGWAFLTAAMVTVVLIQTNKHITAAIEESTTWERDVRNWMAAKR